MMVSGMNRLSSMHKPFDSPKQVDPSKPPPNIHGTRFFLVKFQFGVDHLFLYDRQKSMPCYAVRSLNPGVFSEFMVEMQNSPRVAYNAQKMYRWARREGDWDLSVCLDKLPQEVIKWWRSEKSIEGAIHYQTLNMYNRKLISNGHS